MLKLCVADISAFLEPSTTASTTTEFPGFLDSAALRAPAAGAYREYTLVRGYFCRDSDVSMTKTT